MRNTLLLALALSPFAALAQAPQNGRTYNALIVGSFSVNNNYVLVGNEDYPNIAEDYVAMYAKARALPVDVFLGSQGRFYGVDAKCALLAKQQAGDTNPSIDHAGYPAHVATQERRFRAMLATR